MLDIIWDPGGWQPYGFPMTSGKAVETERTDSGKECVQDKVIDTLSQNQYIPI